MAKYRKDQLNFNIPTNSNRQGLSFVPFAGLEINDNPLLNTQSSASDMLNMVVDDNYFLTMRPRLVEDDTYNTARALIFTEYDAILDTLYLKTGLYIFIARYFEDDDWFVVVDKGRMHHVKYLEGIKFYGRSFENYIVKQDSDKFRFTAIKGEHYSLILSWNDNNSSWELAEEEAYIPRYRAVITQPTKLIDQPIFEDLNIMTNKYKLSVLYDEDGGVDLQSFYTSAIDVEGSPYYLDVGVAGVTENEGVVVVPKGPMFSQIMFTDSAKGYVEIYNGTPYTFSLQGLYIDLVGVAEDPEHLYDVVGHDFLFEPGTTVVLRGYGTPTIAGIDTYPSDNITTFLGGRGNYGIRILDMRYGAYGIPDFFGSQINTPAISPQFSWPTCLIRKPTVLEGALSGHDVYNPSLEWNITYTSSTADLGSHTIDDRLYGDGSFFGSGQRALCYEGSSYSLYYDYQDVYLKMQLGTTRFDVEIWRIDHATKINSLFTTIRVGALTDDSISSDDFKRLWSEDIVYDSNSNIVYTLHYDLRSNKFIRANFNILGGDNSIGTVRGGNYNTPRQVDATPELEWFYRYNDIVYYTPGSHDAGYYNTMDLDIDNSWLVPSPFLYRNNNYFRNYYLNGVIFTVHSGMWGSALGGHPHYYYGRHTNFGMAITMTDLVTLKTTIIIGDSFTENATPINHQYDTSASRSHSLADVAFRVTPSEVSTPTFTKGSHNTYNDDFIKGIFYDGMNYIILSGVNLQKALDNESFTQTKLNQSTYVYTLTSSVLDIETHIDLSEVLGEQISELGLSRTIGIRNINTQALLFNYVDEIGEITISKGRPFFYIMTTMGNAAKTIDVGAVLSATQTIKDASITASGNFRLLLDDSSIDERTKVGIVDLEKTITLNRASIGIFSFAEGITIKESNVLDGGSIAVVGDKDGYYYYGIIAVNKDEVIFTYDLINNTSNPLRLDKELIDEHKRRYDDWHKESISNNQDYDLIGAVDMADSRLYYTRHRLYLTFPDKNNYIPVINCFNAKRPIRSATAYLQQVGAVYEENNVEYVSVEKNPFVEEQYLMHTYIPRLFSVEQPAIDYIESKTLVTFTGMTVYLSSGGLYALNFDAETPQDDQRKATLISKAVNPKLLKYDLNKAILANFDPYVLIMFPEDEETHVFAFKLMVNQWFFWKLPIVIDEVAGDNFTLRMIYGDKMAVFNDEPIIIESNESEYHGNVEQYMDFDKYTIPWFWKSQILAMGNITKRKQVTETYFTFVNNNANVVLDEDDHFDIIERRVTTQAFGLRYLTFKDSVDIAPRVEYDQSLNIINNLRKRTYLNRFNYCQLLCYNIDKENPIQDKVRIANIVVVYKVLTGGK